MLIIYYILFSNRILRIRTCRSDNGFPGWVDDKKLIVYIKNPCEQHYALRTVVRTYDVVHAIDIFH